MCLLACRVAAASEEHGRRVHPAPDLPRLAGRRHHQDPEERARGHGQHQMHAGPRGGEMLYGTCSSFLCVHSSSPPVLMLAHCHWASLLPSCSCHCRLDLPPFMLCSWAVHAVWLAIATCHAVRQACQGSIAFIRHVKIQLQCMRTPGVVRVCNGEAAACFALRLLPASNF